MNYKKNYKPLKKEIEEDYRRWRDRPCLWLSIHEKLKLDPCLSPYASINSKWIKDLNIRPETLKLVQERAGNTLEVIVIGKDFLNRTPAAQQLRERMDKWDFIKLKTLHNKRNGL
jgi:hypothetical protein